jgi:hypothetical protein
MHLRLLGRNLPSFLPSKCGAPALARVCRRFGLKRPFEIYRHLSTPATIADTIGEPRRRSGQRLRRAGIERLKLLFRRDFSHIFLPSRCRTGGVVESHHQDRSTRTSRRTIWRSQIDPKRSGRALHQRTVSTRSLRTWPMLRSIAQIPNSPRLDHLNEALCTEPARIQSSGRSACIGFTGLVFPVVPGDQSSRSSRRFSSGRSSRRS